MIYIIGKSKLLQRRGSPEGSRWLLWLLGWHDILAGLTTVLSFGTLAYNGQLPASGRYLRSVRLKRGEESPSPPSNNTR